MGFVRDGFHRGIKKGFSITISLHRPFRGIGFSRPFEDIWVLNLGWLRIGKRPHIETMDRRVEDLVDHKPYEMR